VPHVEQDVPMVCAWCPSARAFLLWNLAEQPQTVTVRLGDTRREVAVGALDVELVEGVGV
jgi:hypothetical protein